jgi:hypothetical protein
VREPTAARRGEVEEALFLELLARGHRARLRAFGWSMWPLLWPGAEVTLEPPPFVAPPLRVGDVALARSGGCLRLHRVVALREGEVTLQGDSAWRPDPAVAASAVLGRAVLARGRALTPWPLGGLGHAAGLAAAALSRARGRAADTLQRQHK